MTFTHFCKSSLMRSTLYLFTLSAGLIQLQAAAPDPAHAPAKVDHPVSEASFNTITLTPKAEERLHIKTAAINRQDIPFVRTFGGEVIAAMPEASESRTDNSQSIFSVLPGMAPAERLRIAEAQVETDAAVAAAQVQLEAARISMDRADRMLKEKSGSQRAVDDARAQLQLAETQLAKAVARRELLGPPVLYSTTPERIWIRVPVYVGDLKRLDKAKSAKVRPLAADSDDPGITALPVNAPPSANASASSVDLFYACENTNHQFQLGERVGISLAFKASENALVVPWASVITDIYGGTWVYQNMTDHQYARQRVQVQRVEGDLAILAAGPQVGSRIVTDGAAELFGTEVGFSK